MSTTLPAYPSSHRQLVSIFAWSLAMTISIIKVPRRAEKLLRLGAVVFECVPVVIAEWAK